VTGSFTDWLALASAGALVAMGLVLVPASLRYPMGGQRWLLAGIGVGGQALAIIVVALPFLGPGLPLTVVLLIAAVFFVGTFSVVGGWRKPPND
jgi:hypothetical protein